MLKTINTDREKSIEQFWKSIITQFSSPVEYEWLKRGDKDVLFVDIVSLHLWLIGEV